MNVRFVDLIEMEFGLPKDIRRKASWLVHPQDVDDLLAVVDANGKPLWEKINADTDGERILLLGYPLVASLAVYPGEVRFEAPGGRIVRRFAKSEKE